MDDLDRKILALLAKNARMPVKEIAEKVALTSPAVSSRIHKLETDGIISGYTVMLNRPSDRVYVDALISLSVAPSQRDELVELMKNSLVTAIGAGGVLCQVTDREGNTAVRTIECDTVVVASGVHPDGGLARALEALGMPVTAVGNAKQLCRAIGAIKMGAETGCAL